MEELKGTVKVKEEVVEDEEAVEIIEPEDEEMDEGTDYANNYFDNGEGYEDDEDNMDEGPIYWLFNLNVYIVNNKQKQVNC